MRNTVNVIICGRNYSLVPDDETSQLETIAAQVDRAMQNTLKAARTTPLDAAVLTAINAVEMLGRSQDSLETIRSQLQDTLEENKRLRQELADTRRELTRAKNSSKKAAK